MRNDAEESKNRKEGRKEKKGAVRHVQIDSTVERQLYDPMRVTECFD